MQFYDAGTLFSEGWRRIRDGRPRYIHLKLGDGEDVVLMGLARMLLRDADWADGIHKDEARERWTEGVLCAAIQEIGLTAVELLHDLSGRRKEPARAFASMLNQAFLKTEDARMSPEERAARSGNREWYEDLKRERQRDDF